MCEGRHMYIGRVRVFIPKGMTVAQALNVHKSDFFDKHGKPICAQIAPRQFISLTGFRFYYGEPLDD